MSFTAVRELRIYWEKLLLHLFELLNKIEHILDLAHDVCQLSGDAGSIGSQADVRLSGAVCGEH